LSGQQARRCLALHCSSVAHDESGVLYWQARDNCRAATWNPRMRPLFLLVPLLLAGCVDDSATYYIDGKQHALTIRTMQEKFWKKEVTVDLIATNMPDCQRRMTLGDMPIEDVEIELFGSGPDVYTLRAGDQAWRVESAVCREMEAPEQVVGEPLGLFHLDENKKFVFEKAEAPQ
jgi:hypothetical protein